MAYRFFAAALLTVLPRAASAAPLTEQEAVREALANGAFAAILDAEAAAAEAAAAGAGRWANPQVGWNREQLSTDSYEDIVQLSQQVDISGRLGLEGDAAIRDAEVVQSRHRQTMATRAARTRQAFFGVLFGQERYAVLEAWRQHLAQLSAAVRARADAGDAAEYEARRLEGQLSRLDAELVIADTEREAAWTELSILLGTTAADDGTWPRVAGALLPTPEIKDEPSESAGVEKRGDVAALEAERRAADARKSAAGRWWVPRIDVQGGFKGVHEEGTGEQGFVVGVALELPVFERARGEQDRQAAIARAAAARREALLSAATKRLRERAFAARKLFDAAQQMSAGAATAAAELAQTAQQTYLAGELSVVELLDAERNALETRLEALALALRAHHAVIDIDREMGVIP